jgi:hypothetical protein
VALQTELGQASAGFQEEGFPGRAAPGEDEFPVPGAVQASTGSLP